ncbi:YcxB family protein [Thermus neutrinimicus]|uniref:YcxB family protein n=1 Tax=Thermus neutrinimicus TaxID=2908149 RepID=UPI001FAA0397|nr:YcxB family protein [Thermus neutrinimicus]
MGKYETEFSRLGEEALAKLEGPGGFLAVTEAHLVFVDDTGIRRLELSRIRRVGKGEAGTLLVQGEGDSLVLPLKAFPLEELKAFLEGLKPHVARARKATSAQGPKASLTQETAPPPPPPEPAKAPVWEEEPPPKRDSVELAPEPESPPPAPMAKAGGGRNPLALPLKVLSLLTLAYTVAFVALNPGADPWVLAGVLLGGLGLALTEWSSSTSSR